MMDEPEMSKEDFERIRNLEIEKIKEFNKRRALTFFDMSVGELMQTFSEKDVRKILEMYLNEVIGR
jgi:hypothetical protein